MPNIPAWLLALGVVLVALGAVVLLLVFLPALTLHERGRVAMPKTDRPDFTPSVPQSAPADDEQAQAAQFNNLARWQYPRPGGALDPNDKFDAAVARYAASREG